MNEQTIFNEKFISRSKRFVLQITMTITGGSIRTRMHINHSMISDNTSFIAPLYEDEFIIPVTDKSKINTINDKIIEIHQAIEEFYKKEGE